MSISGVGYSAGDFSSIQTNPPAGNTGAANSISLSEQTITAVSNGTVQYSIASNPNHVLFLLNEQIVNSDSLDGVQNAIDNYTGSLAGSNVYDSPYTTPSAKFLNDLGAIKSAAAAGNLGAAKSILAAAKLAAPDTVAGGIAEAHSAGDVAAEAALMMEAGANMSGYLVTQGYTPAEANAESDAILLNVHGFVGTADTLPQTQLDQITDLAQSLASGTTSTGQGRIPSPADPMFKILEALFEAPTAAASDQTLARLDAIYGTAAINPSVSDVNETSSAADSAGVNNYA